MKILGKIDERTFICEVSLDEVRKVADRYYRGAEQVQLVVGGEFNLSAGHDFRRDIEKACDTMAEAMKAFHGAQKSLQEFAMMGAKLPKGEDAAHE